MLLENGFHFCRGFVGVLVGVLPLLGLLKKCFPPSKLRLFSPKGDFGGVGEGRFGPITSRDGSNKGFGDGVFGDGVLLGVTLRGTPPSNGLGEIRR